MHLGYYGIFSGYVLERLLLKYEIVLKGVLSSGTRIDSEWVEELW